MCLFIWVCYIHVLCIYTHVHIACICFSVWACVVCAHVYYMCVLVCMVVYSVFSCMWVYIILFLSDTCVFVHVACAYLCVNMCTFIWVRAIVTATDYRVTAGTWACEADAVGGGWTCPFSDFAEGAVGALSLEHSV